MTHAAETPSLFLIPTKRVPRIFHLTIVLLLLVALGSSCGKVGAPLPPIRRAPIRPEILTVIQRGNMIILTLRRPDLRALEARGVALDRIDLYRLIEPPSAPPDIDEELFSERAALVVSLPRDPISRAATTETLVIIDGPITDFRNRYSYAARYVNKRGQNGPFSLRVRIEPNGKATLPPANVKADDAAQDTIVIEWTAPENNVDGSAPASVIGYNVYRKRAEESAFAEPLNGSAPVTTTQFLDRSFEYGIEYTYMVRSVSPLVGTEPTESLDSAVVSLTPKDRFAPAIPEGLTAASANGVVSLFWTANTESDLAGYNIFRAESAEAPSAQWIKLNSTVHTLTTFRDEQAQLGRRYYYRLTAVDRTGNESPPSAIISQEVL